MGGSDSKLGWPVVSMHDTTTIVTGANTGIGYETAKHIAFLGGRVILACRSEVKGQSALLRMQADYMLWQQSNPGFKRQLSRSSLRRDSQGSGSAVSEVDISPSPRPPIRTVSGTTFTEDNTPPLYPDPSGSAPISSAGESLQSRASRDEGIETTGFNQHRRRPSVEDVGSTHSSGSPSFGISPSSPSSVPQFMLFPPDAPSVVVSDGGGTEPEHHLHDTLRVEFMQLDLASFESIVNFTEEFSAKGYPLHRLICNAGVAGIAQDLTEDGYEIHFQTNYLGHLLLILRLLPTMRSSGEDVRIISVSAEDHSKGSFDVTKLRKKHRNSSYGATSVYANTKLFQIMMTFSLEKRLQNSNITCYSLNPGNIETQLVKNLENSTSKMALRMAKVLGQPDNDVAKGAATSIYIAVSPNITNMRGYYFHKGLPTSPSSKARKEKDQEVLWNYSLDCLRKFTNQEHLEGLELPDEEATEGIDTHM